MFTGWTAHSGVCRRHKGARDVWRRGGTGQGRAQAVCLPRLVPSFPPQPPFGNPFWNEVAVGKKTDRLHKQGPARRLCETARSSKDLPSPGGRSAMDRVPLTSHGRWPFSLQDRVGVATVRSFSPTGTSPVASEIFLRVWTKETNKTTTGAGGHYRRLHLHGAPNVRHHHGPLDGRRPESSKRAALDSNTPIEKEKDKRAHALKK